LCWNLGHGLGLIVHFRQSMAAPQKKAGEQESGRPALEACRNYSDLGGEL